jgi:hypothetical protein
MPPADDSDAFEAAFRTAVAAVLPSAVVERTARTVIAVKLRTALGGNDFIDVFFNSQNSGLGTMALWVRITALYCNQPLAFSPRGNSHPRSLSAPAKSARAAGLQPRFDPFH